MKAHYGKIRDRDRNKWNHTNLNAANNMESSVTPARAQWKQQNNDNSKLFHKEFKALKSDTKTQSNAELSIWPCKNDGGRIETKSNGKKMTATIEALANT